MKDVNTMDYVTFLKNRYKTDNMQEYYEQVFSSPNTIHLDFNIHDNPAFLVPCAEVYENALSIIRLDKDVSLLSDRLPGVAVSQFARRCLIDEIVLTNDIEGVSSTRREISDVLDKTTRSKKLRFRGLVNKYLKLQETEDIPLSCCEDIRAIYNDLVLDEVLDENEKNAPDGEIFRKDSVSVESATGKIIHQGVYPEAAIISAMNSAIAFLRNDKLEPLIRIAVFHYLFGYIHPFYDGNGRTSRFISSYLLSKELNPLIGYRLSYTIRENIREYYSAFKICNDVRNMGDVTPFVITFLEILREAMEQLKNALNERNTQFLSGMELIEKNAILGAERYYKLSTMLLQASLFAELGIKTQELMEMLDISRTTLKDRLKALEKRGYILSHKEGRVVYYKLNIDALESK